VLIFVGFDDQHSVAEERKVVNPASNSAVAMVGIQGFVVLEAVEMGVDEVPDGQFFGFTPDLKGKRV
jgi:hypothetical protein